MVILHKVPEVPRETPFPWLWLWGSDCDSVLSLQLMTQATRIVEADPGWAMLHPQIELLELEELHIQDMPNQQEPYSQQGCARPLLHHGLRR